jgi:hypothetical protein
MFIELFRLDQPMDGLRLNQYRNGRRMFFSRLSPKQRHVWMNLVTEMTDFRHGPGPNALKRYGLRPLIYPPILLSLLEEAMRASSGSGTQAESVYFAFSFTQNQHLSQLHFKATRADFVSTGTTAAVAAQPALLQPNPLSTSYLTGIKRLVQQTRTLSGWKER